MYTLPSSIFSILMKVRYFVYVQTEAEASHPFETLITSSLAICCHNAEDYIMKLKVSATEFTAYL